jgi:hypothetical protein
MREIVLLGAHADTPQKEITLTETILDWKKYNIPIALCSHYPVSEKIQNLIDYYVFDKNQHLDKSLTNMQYYSTNIVYIIAPYDKPYHAAAAIISYANAIRLIHDKYDLLYMQDYDVDLNKPKLLETMNELYSTNYEMFFFKWPSIPNSYATNIEILKPNGFQNLWGDMQSVQDYLSLVQMTGTQFIEPLSKKIIEYKKLQNITYEFNDNEASELIKNLSKCSGDVGEIPRIYLSSTNDNRAVLFIVNPTSAPIEFEIIDQSLHGTKISKTVMLHGGVNVYWALFDMGRRLIVKWENSSKEYFLFTGESYTECKFKFTSPNMIRCKWEI